MSSLLRAASVKVIMASPLSGACSRTLSASFVRVGESSHGHITTGQPYSILNVLRIQLARLYQKCTGAQGCSVVLPHCSDSFKCERVLWIQPEHVEVGQLGFVIVARFEIIVCLGKKARLSGFLGTGGDEVNARISVTILNKIFDVCMLRMDFDLQLILCLRALFAMPSFSISS